MSQNNETAQHKRGFMQSPAFMRMKKILALLLAAATLVLIGITLIRLGKVPGVTESIPMHFVRVTEAGEEEYEDETICPVEYESEDG